MTRTTVENIREMALKWPHLSYAAVEGDAFGDVMTFVVFGSMSDDELKHRALNQRWLQLMFGGKHNEASNQKRAATVISHEAIPGPGKLIRVKVRITNVEGENERRSGRP